MRNDAKGDAARESRRESRSEESGEERSTAVRGLKRFGDCNDSCRIAVLNRLGQGEPRKMRNDAKEDAAREERGEGREE